jgi:hypothetical protein
MNPKGIELVVSRFDHQLDGMVLDMSAPRVRVSFSVSAHIARLLLIFQTIHHQISITDYES